MDNIIKFCTNLVEQDNIKNRIFNGWITSGKKTILRGHYSLSYIIKHLIGYIYWNLDLNYEPRHLNLETYYQCEQIKDILV